MTCTFFFFFKNTDKVWVNELYSTASSCAWISKRKKIQKLQSHFQSCLCNPGINMLPVKSWHCFICRRNAALLDSVFKFDTVEWHGGPRESHELYPPNATSNQLSAPAPAPFKQQCWTLKPAQKRDWLIWIKLCWKEEFTGGGLHQKICAVQRRALLLQ